MPFQKIAKKSMLQCAVPENIHTPRPTDGQWKLRGGWGGGGGGLMDGNFRGVGGVPMKNFSRG